MPILVGKETRAIVQGITGNQGSFHARLMLEYGTKIVAGVTPGKGGTKLQDVPVYDTVATAKDETNADSSVIFVPAPYAKEAAMEAMDAALNPVVIITEGIPARDEMVIMRYAREHSTVIVGPNTPGVITPGQSKLGIMPGNVFRPGSVGLASRSGTLTYEIAASLTHAGIGQSTCLGIGGDPIVGLSFVDVLKMFREDSGTESLVLIGEIGGTAEEDAAKYIADTRYPKPVVAYVTGKAAPPGKRMGHAGAIITGSEGTADNKIRSLVYRLRKPKTATLIFSSVKMVCTGSKSERQARKAVLKVVDDLKRDGIVILGKPESTIQNIVASAGLGGYIDLEKATYGLKKTMYEPEQFPGLIYRMDEPKVVILLFASGKLVCTGAKREIQVGIAVNKLQQILESKNLIFSEGTEKPRLPPLPAKELEKERLKVEQARAKQEKEKTDEKDKDED